MFSTGAVERVKKIRDYAFVHFNKREHAVEAMKALNGKVKAAVNVNSWSLQCSILHKATCFISSKTLLEVLSQFAPSWLFLYSWIYFPAALLYTNDSFWLLGFVLSVCPALAHCSDEKKKKNKTGKAERRTRKGGVRIPPGSHSHPCSRLPTKTLAGQRVNGKVGQTRSAQTSAPSSDVDLRGGC